MKRKVFLTIIMLISLLAVLSLTGCGSNDNPNGLQNVNVGDYIKFGKYEQDNNTSNGQEDIEWLVLEVKDGKALVISKYALDCQPYNQTWTEVTWELCTLRTWLNGEFYNSAFSSEEQKKIAKTTVTADKNPSYSTNPGNNTEDKVFLLSISEAEKYFKSNEARKCAPTAYAKAKGVYINSSYTTAGGKAACVWWLRSPGYFSSSAAYVFNVGSVFHDGSYVLYASSGVRPALWINLG